MLIKKSKLIEDLLVIKSRKVTDNRGFFQRIFCKNFLKKEIKQINISFNETKGTLRGFHYQKKPSKENKFISCLNGEIFNVVIDMRVKSKSYKKQFIMRLKEGDNTSLYIPAGCANCFLTLRKNTKVLYLMTDFYKPKKNQGFNHKSLNINWPIKIKKISVKDSKLKKINFYKNIIKYS